MRALVIEDEEHKRKQLLAFFSASARNFDVTVASSVRTAIQQLDDNKYDVVVLDMSLPTFDMGPRESGGRPQGFGGREIMRHMERVEKECPVIIVTQWERFGTGRDEIGLSELTERLASEHPG